MPITTPNKQPFIRSLQNTRNKGDGLELELLLTGKEAAAKTVREATDRLSKEIRNVIDAAKKTWRGQAHVLEEDMRMRNANLQGTIRDIKKKVKIAQNVVKAVGFIDDAVALAAKVIAPT